MEKALIVGVELNTNEDSIDYSLDELENLANSLDIEVVDRITQKLSNINARYYIGSGKVEEIKNYITACDIDTVIFDDELSPSQIRNLEKELNLKLAEVEAIKNVKEYLNSNEFRARVVDKKKHKGDRTLGQQDDEFIL